MTGQTTNGTAMGQLREAVGAYVTHRVGAAAGKLGERVSGVTGKLGDFVENGGRTGGDQEPDSSDGGQVTPGDTKTTSIVEVLDVGVPLRTAYDCWTRYEEFGRFAKGVESVTQDDDTASTWSARIGPSSRSFEATVQEQIPDDRIVWTSTGAKGSTQGAVSFHELTPTLTRMVLVVEYHPAGFFEKTANLWRAQGRRVRLDFKHFQRYVTLVEEEPRGWRGEIRDGEVVRTDEEVRAEEESDAPSGDDSEES